MNTALFSLPVIEIQISPHSQLFVLDKFFRFHDTLFKNENQKYNLFKKIKMRFLFQTWHMESKLYSEQLLIENRSYSWDRSWLGKTVL
jgi:hypothetical protein